MRPVHLPVVLLLLGAGPVAARAQVPGTIASETYQLPNGLTVVLAEDHDVQVVAVDVWYDVGSRNEIPGRTGLAHLFEHLMFQGSAHVAPGEHTRLVEAVGGETRGQTEDDVTRFHETLPSNRLNLGLWLEADRMRSLQVTDTSVATIRAAVKEERRLGLENQAYTGTFLEGIYAAYDSADCFPYAHTILGSMADLDSASTADAAGFFHRYYAPNNARLVVVGDFDPAATRRLIAQDFGDIARTDAPPVVRCTAARHPGPRRQTVPDRFAALPAVARLSRIPPHDDPDTPALELLATILGQGQNSRLRLRLGEEARAVASAQAGIFVTRRGPQVFGAFVVASQGVPADSVDGLLAAEIARVADAGVTEPELARARNVYLAGLASDRQRPLDIAEGLQHAATFHGSADAINTDPQRYLGVTVDDIKRVARTYLNADNTLILLVTPGSPS
jgi:predicted Zn-dependent peptidase